VEAVRHYPTDELSLAVPFRAGSATTVETCLKMWSNLERVDWICFRCSLHKTLEKIQGDVKRMVSRAGTTTAAASGPSSGDMNEQTYGYTNREDLPHVQSSDAGPAKMTISKKKRLREVRRKEALLRSILEGGFSEDEIEAARLLENAEIKLEKAFSSLSTKQVMIARTPKVLLLHLNRSSYSSSNFGASKNNSRVYFDEHLDVSEVVTNGELNISGSVPISRGSTPMHDVNDDGYLDAQLRQSQTLYRLCAIVVHYGSHSAGHYVSFRRRSIKRHVASKDEVDEQKETRSDAWFRISDDSVSPCSLQDVLTQNPFILYYERLDAIGGQSDPARQKFASSLPKGFEAFGRNEMQKNRSIFRPRVVERWHYVQ
jgi:ubiquitin carboxyl-terminal hydrolase 1